MTEKSKVKEEKQATTREEYQAMEFNDSGYGLGEDDYFDEVNEFDEEEDEEMKNAVTLWIRRRRKRVRSLGSRAACRK